MKKITVLTILFIFIGVIANAQEFGWGPKVSFNSSRLTHSTKDNKAGLAIGGFVAIPISRSLEIEASMMYSRQGANMEDKEAELVSGIMSMKNVRTNVNYLNFPILLKVYLLGGLNVFAGPQIGAILSAKYKYNIVEKDTKVSQNIKSMFKGGDVALVVGAGYQFNFGLSVAVNYNLGMIKTVKYQNIIDDLSSKTKSGVFQITTGWRF